MNEDAYITGQFWPDLRALLSHALWTLAFKLAPHDHPYTEYVFEEFLDEKRRRHK